MIKEIIILMLLYQYSTQIEESGKEMLTPQEACSTIGGEFLGADESICIPGKHKDEMQLNPPNRPDLKPEIDQISISNFQVIEISTHALTLSMNMYYANPFVSTCSCCTR